MTKDQLADFSSTMLYLGAHTLWAINADEKVSKWQESTVAGPKCGFTEELKKQLQQLSRAMNSGAKNRQIIDKLVPWFEQSGINNLVLSMYTGNVRLIVTDKTHFTLEARQLCKDQCQRRVNELPSEMTTACGSRKAA